MKKVLVTCFEPFGANAINTSKEAVDKIDTIEGVELKKLLVPVLWWKSVDLITKTIIEFQPEAVVMCGLAANSDSIRVERQGENRCGRILDNDKKYANDENPECEIVPDGEEFIMSTFNFTAIWDCIHQKGIPVSYSDSAGKYICNHILYSILAKTKSTGIRAGFIHVPNAKEIGGPIPLDDIKESIVVAIQNA